MSKGFIFYQNLCVGCSACTAACILENGWGIHARRIITFNSETDPSFPLTNLSLACNHCEIALCLEGCPVSAYTRDEVTGAIVIDETKCIGCKYCIWNCPYDAPVFDPVKRIIGKCNLCFSNLKTGIMPACTTACPTGALKYGDLTGINNENIPDWFPQKDLKPEVAFASEQNLTPLQIFPERKNDNAFNISEKYESIFTPEWSLVAFTFLMTVSVSLSITSLLNGTIPGKWLFTSIIISAGLLSMFHLGRADRAWRALANIRKSPLSREIALFLVYSIVAITSVFTILPALIAVSSLAGLLLLIVIDSVYLYSDRRKSVLLHSGQTFLSALLIVSFFTGSMFPFVFIATLKILSSVCRLIYDSTYKVLRFFRIALLLVAGISLISKISITDPVIAVLLLTGEFIDRVQFYLDFNPININNLVRMHLKNK